MYMYVRASGGRTDRTREKYYQLIFIRMCVCECESECVLYTCIHINIYMNLQLYACIYI